MESKRNIYHIGNQWYLKAGIFNPFTGEMYEHLAQEYHGENITADRVWFCMLNDCNVSGLGIAMLEGKYGLFPLKERTGQQSGEWTAMCDMPFIYDDAIVFADWNLWDDYGYVAVKKDDKWALIKITQFPSPKSEILSSHAYESPEAAFKGLGIEMSEHADEYRYMHEVEQWD